jgi:hypothetical protein
MFPMVSRALYTATNGSGQQKSGAKIGRQKALL